MVVILEVIFMYETKNKKIKQKNEIFLYNKIIEQYFLEII